MKSEFKNLEVVNEHLNPNKEIREGVMVRWPEFPDRLYIVKEVGIKFCNHDDYCKIETIDHKWSAMVPVRDLVWDDVDYVECRQKI